MAGTRTAITIRPFPKPSCTYRRMISLTTLTHRENWRTIQYIGVIQRIGSAITRATLPHSASTRRCGGRERKYEKAHPRPWAEHFFGGPDCHARGDQAFLRTPGGHRSCPAPRYGDGVLWV